MLSDTHCHLDFPEFDLDRDEVIRRAKDEKIAYIVNVGSSLDGSKRSIELSGEYDFIYAAVGIHPHEADTFNEEIEGQILDLAKKDKVVAIGEIGLDYYRNYSQAGNQVTLFKSLLKLAKDLALPVVIHSRAAQDDTLNILKKALPIKAVVHCFSGDENFLKECLQSGFYISYTCNITYKKADNLRNLVRITPLERLLLETDAPFLPPEGERGKRNEPAFVKNLAAKIARIKGLELEEIAKITTENAKFFFGLK